MVPFLVLEDELDGKAPLLEPESSKGYKVEAGRAQYRWYRVGDSFDESNVKYGGLYRRQQIWCNIRESLLHWPF